jgi:hypothetical protein
MRYLHILCSVGIVVSILSGVPADAAMRLAPAWRAGSVSLSGRPVVRDMTGDGVADLVGCAGSAPVVLTRDGHGGYRAAWTGPEIGCSGVDVGDMDNDGRLEIFVATRSSYVLTTPAKIFVFRMDSLSPIASTAATFTEDLNGIAVGDVDGDGSLEVVTASSHDLWVLDARTLQVEWFAQGKGGFDFGIANIDATPGLEIVVNGVTGHVLDASTKTEKWGYSGGWGNRIALGDVDGDGRAEILTCMYYASGASVLTVFDPETLTTVWVSSGTWGYDVVGAADVDGDGKVDVLAVSNQWGQVDAFRGFDGLPLWTRTNPGWGGKAVTAADFDGDGAIEIAWSSDSVYIADKASKNLEWTATLPSHSVGAVGDLDANGVDEIVVASGSGYSSPGLRFDIYDRATGALQRSVQLPVNTSPLSDLIVGQLDADAPREIAIAMGDSYYNALIEWHDGQTGIVEGNSATLPSSVTSLIAANMDADPHDEIIAGMANGYIWMFDGGSRYLQSVIGPLGASIRTVAVGDVNGDGVPDLAAATDLGIYAWAGPDFHQIVNTSVPYLVSMALLPSRAGRAAQFIVTTGPAVQAYSPESSTPLWTCNVRSGVRRLAVLTLGAAAALIAARTDATMDVFTLGQGSPCASLQTFTTVGGVSYDVQAKAVVRSSGATELLMVGSTMMEIDQLTPAAIDRDLDGSSKSDVVIENNATGAVSVWLMNGAARTPQNIATAAGFDVAGSGDFDGDTRADLLMRNASTGEIRMWLMNGSTRLSDNAVATPGSDYDVAAVADFDGDGKADILLHHSSGVLGIWRMNGAYIADGFYAGQLPSGYSVAGVADFDGDAKADILLADPYGQFGLWLMNGGSIRAGAYLGSAPGYHVASTADFSGDGKADILLRDSSGNLGLWVMSGAQIASGAYLGSPGGFDVVGSGDYDGDGNTDVLLLNMSTGDVGVWFMNGTTIRSGAFIAALPTGSSIR